MVVVDQVQRVLGSRASDMPLTAAPQQQQLGAATQSQLRPPLDLVQRFVSERQAALRRAALQRDEILQQQVSDQQPRPIAQAQREADRLQVVRDAQLLQTQRLAAERLDSARNAERIMAERETQTLEAQRAQEQRLTERMLAKQEAERIEAQRLEEQREAERLQAEQDEVRLDEEREAERLQAEEDEALRLDAEREAQRVEAQRETTRTEQTRVEEQRGTEQMEAAWLERQQPGEIENQRAEAESVPADSERALVERAALAYRSETERAVADAARFGAAQPLNEQLRIARERLDALEARRIDRVDVSSASLSRLTF
jgi:hypothetical protein